MSERAGEGGLIVVRVADQCGTGNLESPVRRIEIKEVEISPDATPADLIDAFYGEPGHLRSLAYANGYPVPMSDQVTLKTARIGHGSVVVIKDHLTTVCKNWWALTRQMETRGVFTPSFEWAWVAYAAALVVFTAMAAVVVVGMIYIAARPLYGVVIDAGSAHTSVVVYSWLPGRAGDMVQVYGCEFEDLRGISVFQSRPDAVRGYFEQSGCLAAALARVPHSQMNTTPLFLGGTGGMRSLRYFDPVAARYILSNATAALDRYGLPVQAHIMDGTDEGVYGWISVNTALHAGSQHVGTLDWGGASAQITFPVNRTTRGANVRHLDLLDRPTDVYTVSHLCYGQEKALNRYFVALIHQNYLRTGRIATRHLSPCLPRGEVHSVRRGRSLFGKCTHLKDKTFNTRFSQHLDLNFTFVGSGRPELCRNMISDQFVRKKCRQTYLHHRTCFDVRKVLKPAPDLDFFAFSTYWYLAEMFSLPAAQSGTATELSLSTEDYDGLTDRVCHSQDLLSAWGPQRTDNACFKAVFMKQLLTSGYGLKDWTKLKFVSEVDGSSIGWTRGYMTTQAEKTKRKGPSKVAVCFSVVALLAALISIAIVLFWLFPTLHRAYHSIQAQLRYGTKL